MPYPDLETPSVMIDLDQLADNIRWVQAECDALGVAFRPHIKTHKSPQIAQMQLDAGAQGIACQKTSEAAAFVEAGFKDIQIPYNIVGPQKTARLAELAHYAKISVTVDSIPVIDGIAQAAATADVTIHVLVEIVGPSARTGTAPEYVLELARHIQAQPHLVFQGVMIYPSTPEARPNLQAALRLLAAHDITPQVISGGGFGALATAAHLPELTELRIGTYVFGDWRSVIKGWTTPDRCAMKILATVISANDPARVILDSGSKTLTADAEGGVHGHIIEYPDAPLYKVNEEHGFADMRAYDVRPQVGERVTILPIHTCVVTNLHNRLFGVRDGELQQVIDVIARGQVW